ncbi:MAG TPA: YdeI/OmpD-associated family protein [Gemmatimonadaceae bacterium]|nr:YdeI/OmpD-associated family protein [Gemmatimonadaceae bacterium]
MGKRDPRVDAYIAGSAAFARPILTHLREVVHETCPGVEETLKWRSPSFMYHGMLCGFAAFKAHAVFGFWKHSLVIDAKTEREDAMGNFGRLTSMSDLPSRRKLSSFIRKAMELNEQGIAARPVRRSKPKPPVRTPATLAAALRKNAKAAAAYTAMSPSHKREYVEWITEAKTEATRDKRLATTIEWLAEGKPRNWKYM